MSSPNLPDGAFFTTINGRRCTAIPKEGASTTTTTTPPRQDTPATTPAQQQPTPSPDPPQRVQPDPPARDPAQAEPPRQTPVAPPASSARTDNSPSPSSPRLDAPLSTPAPIPPTQNEPENPDEVIQSEIPGPSPTDETGPLITTAPAGPGGIAAGDEAATTRSSPAIGGAPVSSGGSDGPSGLPVAAIVGGVVGGVAFLTMLALLFWFWRKNRRRRRSTLLTPLSTNNSTFGRKERPYVFDQESVGPTPNSAKFKAALGYSFQRFRGQVGGLFAIGHDRRAGSVLSKDNSQYSNITSHSRHGSLVGPAASGAGAMPIKEKLGTWKERLAAVVFFSRRNRGEKTMDPDPFAGVREKEQTAASTAPAAQPDFLTLLGMDERAVEREAQRRRASRRHGSTASMERFLGDLGINIDNSADPFADANAIPEEPKRAAPANPFDDSHATTLAPMATPAMATRPGANYVADVRRSRNASVSGVMTRPSSMQRPHSSRYDSVYRASGESVESFATRRARCRSDPFDLERPELLSSSGLSEQGSPGPVRMPGAAHVRNDSYASKYSSGINSAGWSDPGPDIGTSNVIGGRFSPNSGWRPGAFPGREDRKRMSNGSQETQGSVGKAM